MDGTCGSFGCFSICKYKDLQLLELFIRIKICGFIYPALMSNDVNTLRGKNIFWLIKREVFNTPKHNTFSYNI